MKHSKTGRSPAVVARAIPRPGGEIVVYTGPDGTASLEVRLEADTVWLNLSQMARLFGRDKSVVSRHLRNVFATKELDRPSTVAFFATVQREGGHSVERAIEHFNLDAILSVGYRVNSKRGTQFRIWATRVLHDHLLQGYSVNERRLKELSQTVRLLADVAERRFLQYCGRRLACATPKTSIASPMAR